MSGAGGVRFAAQHSVGVETPLASQASRSVAPSGTVTALPSMVSETVRLMASP